MPAFVKMFYRKHILNLQWGGFCILGIFLPVSLGYAQTQEISEEAVAAFADVYRQEKRAKSKLLSRDAQDTLKGLYQEALWAYRRRNYEGAKGKLQDMETYLSQLNVSERAQKIWQRKIVNLSEKIRNVHQRQSKVRKAQQKKEKILAKKKKAYETKVRKQEVQKEKRLKKRLLQRQSLSIPDQALLDHLKGQQRELQAERERVQQELMEGIEGLYTKALILYKEKKYWQAKEIFHQIQQLMPNYKKTVSYLKNIDRVSTQNKN